jgi:hypothetical protein
LRADLVLDETGRRWKQHVGRNRRDNDGVEIAGGDSTLGESSPGGFGSQIARCHTFVDNMTLANSDAAHDPFVVGIDHFFEVGVGQKAGWNVGTESADLNALKLAQ